jgi:hypothetical protein
MFQDAAIQLDRQLSTVSPQQIADKWTLNERKVGSKALRDADRKE